MARLSRIKFSDVACWYHLYAKVSCERGQYPLARAGAQRKLLDLIEHYSQIYYCDVASFCVMGNHYHLVARFDQFVEMDDLDNDDFCDRLRKLYPNTFEQAHKWSKEQYERLHRRLFDVSEFMRQVQSAYTRWYNRQFKRSGALWADRFKSTVLANAEALQDCMMYVDLNPVRAGLVSRPEDYQYCSLHYREMNSDKNLIPLSVMFAEASTVVYRYYKARVYYRGEIPTKEGQGRIRETIVKEAELNAFARKGVLRKRLRHFTEGLVLGSKDFVQDQLEIMKKDGVYLRRISAIGMGGLHASAKGGGSGRGAFVLRPCRAGL